VTLHGRLLAFLMPLPQMVAMAEIDVIGAGIVGLWQAYLLRRKGYSVVLWDKSGIPGGYGASRLAGAMLAPYCEGEPGHEVAQTLGIEALPIWKEHYPHLKMKGTLVVAAARDHADLKRFESQTRGYSRVMREEIASLEPSLEGRFGEALFFAEEAHVEPLAAMEFLANEFRGLGGEIHNRAFDGPGAGWIVDCRGIAAGADLPSLRGVRGERILIKSAEVTLNRPIRLLHPRIPFYIVPWTGGRFMVGATVIESEDSGPPTLRSAAELMSCAYALIPALGEARIIDIAAGLRPSFPDNTPKIIARGKGIFVNGSFRHGFLVSPILAQLVADYIEKGLVREGVILEDFSEWRGSRHEIRHA
jgi:glycine oxidase